MRDKILRINQSKDKFCGIIKTNERTITYRFDGDKCCNLRQVQESRPLTEMIGKCITEMDLVEVEEQPRDDPDRNKGGKVCFSIMCGEDIYYLTALNHHNGYYVMNFDVEIDNKPLWNLAI